MKAIVVRSHGGPDQLQLEDVDDPSPRRGEVVVRVEFAGVNFMDVGFRRGGTSAPIELPFRPGVEGAGVVVAVGDRVERIKVGDPVAWFLVWGSYAELVKGPEQMFVPLPARIESEQASAILMQGLTASNFVFDVHQIRPGDTALVLAAAGGVGQMVTQMVKLLGGRVIGVVSRDEKVPVARAAGADEVIVPQDRKFAHRVLELTEQRGVQVVYDGNGGETFHESLQCLDFYGTLALYGPLMDPTPPIDIFKMPKSIRLTYPVVGHHVRTVDLLERRSRQIFEWMQMGSLNVNISARYPLAQAAQAHADLESRLTTGKLLLVP